MTLARRCLSAILTLSLTMPLATPVAAQREPDPLSAVDPFIGTGGQGHTFPGAVAPFGMVQLSPDTDTNCVLRDCYPHAAGYRYEDATIQGFSHTHFSGAGHSVGFQSRCQLYVRDDDSHDVTAHSAALSAGVVGASVLSAASSR